MSAENTGKSAAEAAAEVTELTARLTELVTTIVDERLGAEVDNEAIADILAASARLFQAKTDRVGKIAWPIRADQLTATETVVLVNALLDAADVNLFDMAIWYRRAE